MKSIGGLLRVEKVWLVLIGLAAAGLAPAGLAQATAHVGGDGGTNPMRTPQEFVECTGWHALCSASTDCKVTGDRADCDCLRVKENHLVETKSIQDLAVKRRTQIECTNAHPCKVDEAPVCKAIEEGPYIVGNTSYEWVSTYSYRGWCGILQAKPKACDPSAAGYVGDTKWAICDAAPCTEIQNPTDPEKPLSCQCRVEKGAFVGSNGSCTGDRGGIMSSMPMAGWDFKNNTYTFAMPGYEYVQGACAALRSDPCAAGGVRR